MLKAGSKIKILKSSYGWGKVIKGDMGVIKHVDKLNSTYCVDVPGKSSNWSCKTGDIAYSRPKTDDKHAVTVFVDNRYKYMFDQSNDKNRSAETRKRWSVRAKRVIRPDTELLESINKSLRQPIIVSSSSIVEFVTKDIIITHRLANGTVIEVPMGYFRCIAYLGNDPYMEIRQQDGSYVRGDDHGHPHISGNNPCLGTYASSVYDAMRNLDICQMVSVIMDYLTSCDRHGWYNSILDWVSDEDRKKYEIMDICPRCEFLECECDYCERCNREGDTCRCRYCDVCDNREDDCACMRCPDSWDQLEDERFPDVHCATCPNLCRNVDNGRWQCLHNGDVANPYYDESIQNYVPNDDRAARYTTVANGAMSAHPNEEKHMEELRQQLNGITQVQSRSTRARFVGTGTGWSISNGSITTGGTDDDVDSSDSDSQ